MRYIFGGGKLLYSQGGESGYVSEWNDMSIRRLLLQ
jgi:hypothetical protein